MLLLSAAGSLTGLQICCGAERWRLILRALRQSNLPVGSVYAAFYSSIFFNQFPLGNLGGDIARVWLARKFHRSLSEVILSVLVDHGFALVGILMLAVLMLPWLAHPLVGVVWAFGVSSLVAIVAAIYILEYIEASLKKWEYKLVVVYKVLRLTGELRRLRGDRQAVIALAFALLSAVCGGVAGYCIARSLDITIDVTSMIAVMSLVTLASVVPISIAGWGIREASMVSILAMLGVGREQALLLSLEIGLSVLLLSLPGGIAWLFVRNPTFGIETDALRIAAQARH
jgi:glycosyltransferase 2 family protein